MSSSRKQTAIALVAAFVALVLAEHTAKMSKAPPSYHPAHYLWILVAFGRHNAHVLGAYCAWIGSFLVHLHLDELLETVYDLARPLVELTLVWWYFVKGYWQYIQEHVLPSWVVVTGSYLAAASVIVVVYYLRPQWFNAVYDKISAWSAAFIEWEHGRATRTAKEFVAKHATCECDESVPSYPTVYEPAPAVAIDQASDELDQSHELNRYLATHEPAFPARKTQKQTRSRRKADAPTTPYIQFVCS